MKKIDKTSFIEEILKMQKSRQNKLSVDHNGYKAFSYKDYMFGEKFYNFEIVKDDKMIFHSTITKPIKTKEQLLQMLKDSLEVMDILKKEKGGQE